jgi:DNA modification methylase
MPVIDAVICSPPFSPDQPCTSQSRAKKDYHRFTRGRGSKRDATLTGTTPGQIGSLKMEDLPVTAITDCETLTWEGCYREGWGSLLTPQSFGHPAKAACGLLKRILSFGLERGFWKPGDVLADCFGGVGTTGLMAAYEGLRSVSVELEPRFVQLAQDNIALHRFRLEKLGYPLPVCLQGDSRQFARLAGGVAAVVTSPPWADQAQDHDTPENYKAMTRANGRPAGFGPSVGASYGTTPGQVGALPEGSLDAVLTSPPYAESIHEGQGGTGVTSKNDRRNANWKGWDQEHANGLDGCGTTPGQVGALPEGSLDAVLTSPPYADTGGTPSLGSVNKDEWGKDGRDIVARRGLSADYGTTPGQIGQEQGDSYWRAMREIYAQVWQALKPAGVLCVVIKSYVRNKQLVDLPGQTCTLLEALGFRVFLRVRATFTETTVEPGLFGEVRKTKKRASFFRRLAEKKGAPVIDHEDVIMCRREENHA